MSDDFYWEKYKWEFMRRSAEFRSVYAEYQTARESGQLLPYILKENLIPRILTRLLSRFGYSPDISGYPRVPNPDKTFEEEFKPEEVPDFFDKSYDISISNNVLRITINLDEINSVHEIKTRMLADFEEALGLMKQSGKKPKSRKRIDYDAILKVGDLKEEGLTYQQIAKRIFPRDFNNNNEKANPESAIRKVGQYYQKYRELVDGGYKDVTFP